MHLTNPELTFEEQAPAEMPQSGNKKDTFLIRNHVERWLFLTGNYKRGLYHQLMEVLNDEISVLKKENQRLWEENRLLPEVAPVITEIRIYTDEQGHYAIPAEYRSDEVYGSNVKAMAIALYREGVMSNDRISAF